MLLVVCPNLAVDRILSIDDFQPAKVQRCRSVITQPGGKGSNVARVFRQLGGEVVLAGFVGRANAEHIVEPLRAAGIRVHAVTAFSGESRTCTIVCDSRSTAHPTVINEESPTIEPGSAAKLEAGIRKWLPRVDGVIATGSLSTGLPSDFYACILHEARRRRKITGIDAAGDVLRVGLSAHPDFMKPNTEEFFQLVHHTNTRALLELAPHTAITFGKAGAALIHGGKCVYASPPRIFHTNPIGAGDAFAAAYMKYLLDRQPAVECLRIAVAAAASDASTLRPGLLDASDLQALAAEVELRFS